MTYKTTNSQKVYEGRVFTVYKDLILFPNGNEHQIDLIVHPGAVAILPIDKEDNILFVSQYRHATGGNLLEIPAGVLELNENPESCAQRELKEEVGMGAKNMEKIGEFYLLPAYSTQKMFIFMALDLYPEKLPGDEDEDLEIHRIKRSKSIQMLQDGEIFDAKTAIALNLAFAKFPV